MFLRGDFADNASAGQALRQLNAAELSPGDIDVFSDEPVEFPKGILDRPSRMSLLVVTGAVTFFLLAAGFVYFTQHNYPLITGGMPLFSFWATGVVFYELTMLGAILTTLAAFLWESGLLRRKRCPVPIVEPGVVCLRISCRPDQAEDIRRVLERAGGHNISRMQEAA